MNSDGLTRLETLYRDVGPGLLGYLRRVVGDLHLAEDLLHETFLQAARRTQRLSQAASIRAWLFAIARHVALTARRRRRPTQALPEEVVRPGPSEDMRLEQVRAAIGDLPEALRETLELRLREELSYDEIAEVLQIPVGTVRSRLHHALRRLRAAVVTESVDARGR